MTSLRRACVIPEKPCAACGRTITWRKKWERDWEHVRFCSDACRRAKKSVLNTGATLEAEILSKLGERARGATICPSEVARSLANEDEWRALMEPVRQAARRLVAKGVLDITQGGHVVDASTAKGPIRLRLRTR
ncbi:MAG: DUF2256 and DUF3253 domain-containing protein [Archangiaceae bacterium]|nr:DUF2256 and DUF3253 domain-containing protein [Archangiaceae bacterium]